MLRDVEKTKEDKKGKKVKAPLSLTIHNVVNVTDIEMNKFTLGEIKTINKLYMEVFILLYKWRKKTLANP